MRIRVLGSAAGGGFPQWNCGCPCCRAVRDGSRPARPRTQSSVAVSPDGDRWVLVNASPDIGRQIAAPGRAAPPVLLTDGELDHSLGLLMLREARGVRVAGTPDTHDLLRNGSRLLPLLQAYCPVEWTDVLPGSDVPLREDGLTCRAFDAPTTKRPRFPGCVSSVVGYRFTDQRTGASVACLPCAQELTPAVLRELRDCEILLVDGTFWSDDEMIALGLSGRTARDMGHMPVRDSLEVLAALPAARKVYVHLNNTNPLLLEDSPQRKEAESLGLEIARDGLEIMI